LQEQPHYTHRLLEQQPELPPRPTAEAELHVVLPGVVAEVDNRGVDQLPASWLAMI
jgi:hypothetical protein